MGSGEGVGEGSDSSVDSGGGASMMSILNWLDQVGPEPEAL